MTRGFLPNTDENLLAWSAAFSSAISANPAAVGLTSEEAASYAAFAAGMAACAPSLRNQVSTAEKNTARAGLKLMARQLSSRIQGQASVSDAQKISLGLTVRTGKRVIAPPDGPPVIGVVSVWGSTVKIKLRDVATGGGLPVDVSGASVFSFVVAEPPSDLGEWTCNCNTGRSRMEIAFASSNPPGTQVWLTAFWFNGHKQSGPMCAPVSTYLPGGGVAMAA